MTNWTPVIIWSVVLVALLVAGIAVLGWVRSRLLCDDDDPEQWMADLSPLRAMRARGELTEDEYEAARDAMIGGSRAVDRSDDETPGA